MILLYFQWEGIYHTNPVRILLLLLGQKLRLKLWKVLWKWMNWNLCYKFTNLIQTFLLITLRDKLGNALIENNKTTTTTKEHIYYYIVKVLTSTGLSDIAKKHLLALWIMEDWEILSNCVEKQCWKYIYWKILNNSQWKIEMYWKCVEIQKFWKHKKVLKVWNAFTIMWPFDPLYTKFCTGQKELKFKTDIINKDNRSIYRAT